jgi:competence protein ComFC
MVKIVNRLIDLIFPPRDTELLVRDIAPEQVDRLLSLHEENGILMLARYQTPQMQALIKENKFHRNIHASIILAAMFETWVKQQRSANLILVPIPLGKKRKRERGYNQVEVILRALHPLPHTTVSILLTRTLETTPQTSLKREARLKNLKGAFSYASNPALDLENCTVVIVDDVTTTGATLRSARATLQANLPPTTNIVCVALAH